MWNILTFANSIHCQSIFVVSGAIVGTLSTIQHHLVLIGFLSWKVIFAKGMTFPVLAWWLGWPILSLQVLASHLDTGAWPRHFTFYPVLWEHQICPGKAPDACLKSRDPASIWEIWKRLLAPDFESLWPFGEWPTGQQVFLCFSLSL